MSRRGWLLFIALGVIWGIPYLLIKVAVREFTPASLVFLRTALGAAILFPVMVWRGDLRAVLARWRPIALFTVVEMAIPWLLLSHAELRVTSSLAGLFMASVPLVGAALALCAVAYAPVGLAQLPARMPAAEVVGAVVVLGVACTAVAFLLFFRLIAEVGPVRATVITYVNPAVAVAAGVSLLGEPFTLGTASGFVLILAGSWMATGGSSAQPAPGEKDELAEPAARPREA